MAYSFNSYRSKRQLDIIIYAKIILPENPQLWKKNVSIKHSICTGTSFASYGADTLACSVTFTFGDALRAYLSFEIDPMIYPLPCLVLEWDEVKIYIDCGGIHLQHIQRIQRIPRIQNAYNAFDLVLLKY